MSTIRFLASIPFLLLATAALAEPVSADRHSLALERDAPDAAAMPGGAAPVGVVDSLAVELECASCGARAEPSVTLQWSAPGLDVRGALTTVDWAEGRFAWSAPGEPEVELRGEPLTDGRLGFMVSVPLGGAGLPFRVVSDLPGFVAERAVAWPERDGQRGLEFQFRTVASVLDDDPALDPARTQECDVLIPKSAIDEADAQPLVFRVGGEPRAWLHPPIASDGAEEGADASPSGPWAFQFARPGRSILERISVDVIPSDEGDRLAFRLPLRAVLAADRGPAAAGSRDPAAVVRPALSSAVGTAELAGIGTLSLDDCPRLPVASDDLAVAADR